MKHDRRTILRRGKEAVVVADAYRRELHWILRQASIRPSREFLAAVLDG